MQKHREKMKEFVSRLWTNPGIKDVPAARRENQILGFLKDNSSQLQSALARPELFQGLKWEDTMRMLLFELTETAVESLHPALDRVVDDIASSGVLDQKKGDSAVGLDVDRLKGFLHRLLRSKAVRDQFTAVLQTVTGGFIERYLSCIYERRGVMFNEMIRRDHATVERPAVIAYMEMSSLLRPLYWHKFQSPSGGQLSLEVVKQDNRMFEKLKKDLLALLADEVGAFPSVFLDDAMDCARGINDFREISGSARFLGILVARAQEYDSLQKQDRGAETPDKSWFSINRRTAKYYGYDIRFLEEFYQIAGEKGW